MRALLIVPVVIGLLAGCASAPTPRPIAPDPPETDRPIAVIESEAPIAPELEDLPPNDAVPRSIRRLAQEQKDEVASILVLAERVPDRHGRARLLHEAEDLSNELSAIVSTLGRAAESEELDAAVTRLQELATRTSLIHDALRQAAL